VSRVIGVDASLLRAHLFDDEGTDRPVDLERGVLDRLGERQLLWIDLDLRERAAIDELASLLDLEDETVEAMLRPLDRPRVAEYGRYFHVNVFSLRPTDGGSEPIEVDCLVGRNWVVTGERGELDLSRAFERRVRGDTRLGRLSGPSFLAALLDWLLNEYFRAVEAAQAEIDAFDQAMLAVDVGDEMLRTLVDVRGRIARLRAALSPHREVFADLSRPDFVLDHDGSTAEYARLNDRLESLMESIESLREMIVGSFDLYMTFTAQQTNDIMKVLTVTSVLLLPPTLIASVLGMSFDLGRFDRPLVFFVALGVMVAISAVLVAAVRRKGWL
jgi:magnesium transporter